MQEDARSFVRGRGAGFNPPNRFERLHIEPDPGEMSRPETIFYSDTSRSAFAKNDSPDVGFTFSLNPYRGCEHGCIYCYARPSHEYLGFSSGLDFESRIVVKTNAPELMAKQFESKNWKPQTVALSGNTDPYQPAESKLRLTRKCLEVFLAYRNPVAIITKNYRITKDLDILTELAQRKLVKASISITSLDDDLIGVMEPRTSRPARRLQAIRELSDAGIPVSVMVAPVIPGLTDEEMPRILEAARDHGALSAGYIVMRLPQSVEHLFVEWIKTHFPDRENRVLSRIRSMRGGALSDARFGVRMRGQGEWADVLSRLFRMSVRRFGLKQGPYELDANQFRRLQDGQQDLFAS